MTKPTIGLQMICGDEEKVIRRCLESVKPYIDYWIISCNGTDNTPAIARDVLKDVPGQILMRPWISYGHNRTEALNEGVGKYDWHFIIDADETLHLPDGWPEEMVGEAYVIDIEQPNGVKALRACLLKADQGWEYRGAVHNYPRAETGAADTRQIPGKILHHQDGFTWDDSDAKQLEKARILKENIERNDYKEESDRLRDMFYLGECYFAGGAKDEALAAYEARAKAGGWDEEIYMCFLRRAHLTGKLEHFLEAYEMRPQRPEPLMNLAEAFHEKGLLNLARMFYLATDRVCVEHATHQDKVKHDTSIRDGRLHAAWKKLKEDMEAAAG